MGTRQRNETNEEEGKQLRFTNEINLSPDFKEDTVTDNIDLSQLLRTSGTILHLESINA